MQSKRIFIQRSELGGKGVFSDELILPEEIIETVPVIILPEKDIELINKTHLYNYYFLWGSTKTEIAIALGYGSLYNHSYVPNVAYFMDYEKANITFVAYSKILPGEELLVNYNGEEEDTTPVWFH